MTEMPPAATRRRFRPNLPLWIGGFLVLMVAVVAAAGPMLAPQDPLMENYVARVGGRFIRPPFPPGTEGYPLGADEFGRDVFSRLLWAVRPTLTLVLVVAALRLTLGILVGLAAGWARGRFARWMDSLISSALAVPVLFIALCVIAALASRWGVWAFILGLSLTGWAETARLVQAQARAVKLQPFIEAVRALGGSGGQMLLSHVIPHILPLVWIQLAFEASAALLASAGLGFLGYFMNAVWVPVSDFTGLRASGMPELGQMLGTSISTQPWTAIFAGSVVIIIVLALNLLGEGLQLHFSSGRKRPASAPDQGIARAGSWLEERIYLAVTESRRTLATVAAFALLVVLLAGGGWFLWRVQNSGLAATRILLPGGQLWSAELRDPQGTRWSQSRGPVEPTLLWVYTGPDKITGGPVVDQNGRLYLAGSGKKGISISPGGQPGSLVSLPAEPLGWPALAPDGKIVIADMEGGLSALDPSGNLLWVYQSDPPDAGRSSPVVSANGTIYYTTQNFIVAVDGLGKRTWQIRLPTFSFTSALPRLSPDGAYLFFEDVVVDAATGFTLFKSSAEPMDGFQVGADGRVYLRGADHLMEWQPTEKGAVMIPRIRLDSRELNSAYRFPNDSGVSPSGQAWLLYASGFEYQRMVWVMPGGQGLQITDFPYRSGRFVGIDSAGAAYLCGLLRVSEPVECRAVQLSTGMVLWKTELQTKSVPVGGAIVEGRLYIATEDGHVFAMGR